MFFFKLELVWFFEQNSNVLKNESVRQLTTFSVQLSLLNRSWVESARMNCLFLKKCLVQSPPPPHQKVVHIVL